MADNPQSFKSLFPWQPGDPVLDGLRQLMNVLDALLLPAVTAKTDYEQTIQELRATILTRFNESIQPIFDEITAVASLGAIFTAKSASIHPVGLGTKTFIVDAGARNTFAASPYLAITSRSRPGLAMSGTTTFYDRMTGQLIIDITATSGNTGTAADWDICAAPPPFVPAALDGGVIETPNSLPKQSVRFRRTHMAGAVPALAEFATNTFVLNDADGLLYFLHSDNATVLSLPIRPGLHRGGVTVAAAATVNLGALPFEFVTLTGTATITSFGTVPHQRKWVRLTGDCNIVYNSGSLILPSAASIVGKAGDTFFATSDVNGNWTVRAYTRLSGEPLAYASDIVRAGAAQTLTPTQKRQAKQNIGALGAGIANFSANAALTASHVGFMLVALAGGITLTLPQGSSLAGSDRLSFANNSGGTLSVAVNANDVSSRIYFGKGQNAASIPVLPGGFVDLVWDGGNWYAQGLGAHVASVLATDRDQGLSSAERILALANLGIGGESNVALGGTTDIGSTLTERVTITGSGTINSFGGTTNCKRYVTLTGNVTLTHSGSLICPTAQSLSLVAGDTFMATSDANGIWRVRSVQRLNGRAIGPAPYLSFEQSSVELTGGLILKAGTSVITTRDGNASISYFTAFPTLTVIVVIINGDSQVAAAQGKTISAYRVGGFPSRDAFALNLRDSAGNAVNATLRVDWIAIGY